MRIKTLVAHQFQILENDDDTCKPRIGFIATFSRFNGQSEAKELINYGIT